MKKVTALFDPERLQRKMEREEIAKLVPKVKVDPERARRIAARRKLLRDQLAFLLAQERKTRQVERKSR